MSSGGAELEAVRKQRQLGGVGVLELNKDMYSVQPLLEMATIHARQLLVHGAAQSNGVRLRKV